MAVISQHFCERCGSPSEETVCNDCILHPHLFTRARALGKYNGIIRELVLLFKSKRKLSIGRRLGNLLGKMVQDDEILSKADTIIPVPLYPVAKRTRGYNQSEILCYEVSKVTSIPTITDALAQIKVTKPQKSFSTSNLSYDEQKEQRKANVKGAFKIKFPDKVVGKRIILIDDVCTTGATLDECASELLKGGAKDIYAAVVARAVSS